MNKIKILLISLATLFVLWIISWFNLFGLIGSSKINSTPSQPSSELTKKEQKINLSIVLDNTAPIDYSEDFREGATAFSILSDAGQSKLIKLETKQYDFGVFVESINGFKSASKKSWIYFVNGKSGNIAADKYVLMPGDKVEWKYITPSGE